MPLGKVDDLMTVVLAIQRHKVATASEVKLETTRPQLLGRPATYNEVIKNLPDNNEVQSTMPEYLRTSYIELAGEARKKIIGNASWECRQVLFFSIFIFLCILTILILSSSPWPARCVPSWFVMVTGSSPSGLRMLWSQTWS